MPKITFTKDNITLDVEKGAKVIDVAKESGADVLFGCIDGLCGTCMVTVEDGAENLNPIEGNEKDTLEIMNAEKNQRLACQLKVVGDGEVKLKVDY